MAAKPFGMRLVILGREETTDSFDASCMIERGMESQTSSAVSVSGSGKRTFDLNAVLSKYYAYSGQYRSTIKVEASHSTWKPRHGLCAQSKIVGMFGSVLFMAALPQCGFSCLIP